MTFELMNQIGLSGIDYSYFFIGLSGISLLLLILVIIQMYQIKNLKKRYKKFMSGKDAKSLEKEIEKVFEENNYLRDLTSENKRNIKNINKEIEKCFNKVGIVKYDAFKQMGGMLSFSLALLNDNNDGCILNSVHNTEGCYVYVKEIKSGNSDIELSSEEKEALSKAMNLSKK